MREYMKDLNKRNVAKFLITIDGNADTLNENLKAVANDSDFYDKFIFDITLSNKSVPQITIRKDRYRISYTRPLFYNAFKLYTYDLIYDFEVQQGNPVIIEGTIKIKPFIIWFLILFVGVCIATLIENTPKEDDFWGWLFYILVPVVLPIYFLRQKRAFKKEIKKGLTAMSKQVNVNDENKAERGLDES